SLVTSSSAGCTDTVRKDSIFNIQTTKTSFSAPDSICTQIPIDFQNTSTPAPLGSNWIFGDGTTSTNINPVKTYKSASTYKVKLYNNYSYCTDSSIKAIKILSRPKVNFKPDND